MRQKIIHSLNLVIAALCFSGCTSSNLITIEKVSPNEAIIVAKVRVIYNGQDVTKLSAVTFPKNPSAFGTDQAILDKSGYIFIKRPAGENWIQNICHCSGAIIRHDFNPKELTCQLSANEVNYIGDITFEWNGANAGAAWTIGILSSGILEPCGDITVSVESNFDAAQKAFREKFHTDRDMKLSLLAVDLPADKHKK